MLRVSKPKYFIDLQQQYHVVLFHIVPLGSDLRFGLCASWAVQGYVIAWSVVKTNEFYNKSEFFFSNINLFLGFFWPPLGFEPVSLGTESKCLNCYTMMPPIIYCTCKTRNQFETSLVLKTISKVFPCFILIDFFAPKPNMKEREILEIWWWDKSNWLT